jgi:DNA-binding XRE family transcriptional regulator
MTLSKAILMYRAKHDMTMKQFAEACGVTLQTIYNVETVGQKPSRLTRTKIELVIGTEFEIDEDVEVDT